jgi:hypothetical protein
MNKMTLGLVAASLAASTSAFAQNEDATQDSRYSFVQGSYIPYQNLDTEYGDEDADGVNINVAWHFVEQAYVFGRGDFSDLDDGTDYTTYALGLGLRGPLGDTRPGVDKAGAIDIYLEIGYEGFELESSGDIGGESIDAKLDGEGYGVNIGLRWLATERLEINPFVGYVNYGEPDIELRSGNDTLAGSANEDLDGLRYGLRSVLDLTHSLATTLSFERNQLDIGGLDIDANTVRIGLRWYLPSRGFSVR